MSDTQVFVAVIVVLVAVCVGVGITQWLYGHASAKQAKRIGDILTRVDAHVTNGSMALAEIANETRQLRQDGVTESVTGTSSIVALTEEFRSLRKHVMALRYPEVIAEVEAKLDALEKAEAKTRAAQSPQEQPAEDTVEQPSGHHHPPDTPWQERAAEPVGRDPERIPDSVPVRSYVLNRRTQAIHLPNCMYVPQMDAAMKEVVSWTKQQLIDALGDNHVRTCGRCKPQTKGLK